VARYVALLRGVNVGGKNRVSMAALRELVASQGHTDVATLIQSGNVVFTARRPASPQRLEDAIAKEFGVETTVILRTAAEMANVVVADPFPRADHAPVHVGFLAALPPAAKLKALDAGRFRPDEYAIRKRELYVHLPSGIGRSKLVPYLDRQLGVATTYRNWHTVLKLQALVT
jgi:uncharacterized protein (DUF1697 family)